MVKGTRLLSLSRRLLIDRLTHARPTCGPCLFRPLEVSSTRWRWSCTLPGHAAQESTRVRVLPAGLASTTAAVLEAARGDAARPRGGVDVAARGGLHLAVIAPR